MIKSTHLVRELELRYEREALANLSYEEALERFSALWAEACELQVVGTGDWLTDLKPDIDLARALNGLPPED